MPAQNHSSKSSAGSSLRRSVSSFLTFSRCEDVFMGNFSARFFRLLKATPLSRRSRAGAGDHGEACRPQAIEPPLVLGALCPQPRLVPIDACLRTEALGGAAVPDEAELAVTVGAMIVHGFLRMRPNSSLLAIDAPFNAGANQMSIGPI